MATRILFFGVLKEAAGGTERLVNLPPEISNGVLLVGWLGGDDKILRNALNQPGVRLCVDQSITAETASFDQPGEIAFLPPFSGG